MNSDGVTKDGSEFMLNTTLSGDQFDVALTALGNGVCGWTRAAPTRRSNRTPPFPSYWEDTDVDIHAVTQSSVRSARSAARRSIFSIYSTTSSTSPMPSAGGQIAICKVLWR